MRKAVVWAVLCLCPGWALSEQRTSFTSARALPLQVPADSDTSAISPTSVSLLTPELLTQVGAVLDRFHREPDTVRKRAEATQLLLTLQVSPRAGVLLQGHQQIPVQDLGRLAATVPAVAADFEQAHLSASKYLSIVKAIVEAHYTDSIDVVFHNGVPTVSDTATVNGKNVTFLRTHVKEITTLGYNYPDVQLDKLMANQAAEDLLVGHPAPQLYVKSWLNSTDGGARTTFGDGNIYVLDFTAHWCGPCQLAYPVLRELLTKYHAQGVRVLYVTQLFGTYGGEDMAPAAELDSLKQYITEHGLTAPMAVLPQMSWSGYFPRDGVLPNVVVIDRTGIVRTVFSMQDGFADRLDAAVKPLLSSSMPTPKTP